MCMTLSDAKKRKLGSRYDPSNLFLETYIYDEESTDETTKNNLPIIPAPEGDEEEAKEVNKLLTNFPVLLAQIKAGNNSNKLKNKIRQILYRHNKITKKSLQFNQVYYNNGNNMVEIREPKTFYFEFDLPKVVDKNLKHEIEFII